MLRDWKLDKKTINLLVNDLDFQNVLGVDTFVDQKPNNRFSKSISNKKHSNISSNEKILMPPPLPKKEREIDKNINTLIKDCSSLVDLYNLLINFDGCHLKKTATQIVFSDGNPKAKIIFVGEAPGAEEDKTGKPFVGASGQLLDKMFNSINLSRKSVYITNIIPWRPPGNRTPTEYEINLMKPFLLKHIQIINPKIVVAVGGSAAKALLGINDGILKHRGRWSKLNLTDNLKIDAIATLHPAYLLRSPSQKKLAWEDLKMIREKLKIYV